MVYLLSKNYEFEPIGLPATNNDYGSKLQNRLKAERRFEKAEKVTAKIVTVAKWIATGAASITLASFCILPLFSGTPLMAKAVFISAFAAFTLLTISFATLAIAQIAWIVKKAIEHSLKKGLPKHNEIDELTKINKGNILKNMREIGFLPLEVQEKAENIAKRYNTIIDEKNELLKKYKFSISNHQKETQLQSISKEISDKNTALNSLENEWKSTYKDHLEKKKMRVFATLDNYVSQMDKNEFNKQHQAKLNDLITKHANAKSQKSQDKFRIAIDKEKEKQPHSKYLPSKEKIANSLF